MHKRVLGVVAAIVFIFMVAPISNVFASTFDVSAQVNAPLPPGGELPIVETPDDNSTQTLQNVFVTGQCIVIDPSLIVVLVRDNQTIGTGPCLADGTFRILIGLVKGINTIYPKFVTITGQSSGLGQALTLIYSPPQLPSRPIHSNTPVPATIQGSALQLDFDYDFVTYSDTTPIEVSYTVSGGTKPYIVTINWGDGTQTTAKITGNDAQTANHQYDSVLPPAALTITAVDALGDKVVQSRALVSFKKGVYVPAAQPVRATSVASLSATQFVWVCIGVISIFALFAHHLFVMHLPVHVSSNQHHKKTRKKGTKR